MTRTKKLLTLLALLIAAALALPWVDVDAGHDRAQAAATSRRPAALIPEATLAPPARLGAPDTVVAVGRTPIGRPIPAGFTGLSLEYWALPLYAGGDPSAPDPLFGRLISALAPGRSPHLRIGGRTTDWTWLPTPGLTRPPGAIYSLTPAWLQRVATVAQATNARLTLGLNLAASSPPVAAAEANAMLTSIGRSYIDSFELGNEPNWYRKFAWYRAHGQRIFSRSAGWGPIPYLHQFAQYAAALPGEPLAGPSIGNADWLPHLPQLIRDVPALNQITVHRYPLNRCNTPRNAPNYASVTNLLKVVHSQGQTAGLAPLVRLAHRHGLAIRVDELNSVACGGKAGVSDTFASALWSLDTLFAMAGAGVDGINIHTFPGAFYAPFTISSQAGNWVAAVHPMYYGLLMFTRAAPVGSSLLPTLTNPVLPLRRRSARRATSGQPVRAWATLSTAGRIRVALIYPDLNHEHTVAISVANPTPGALLERLQAPSAYSHFGVSLAGQTFGRQTFTAALSGIRVREAVELVGHRYLVRLPAASAALLTIAPPVGGRGA